MGTVGVKTEIIMEGGQKKRKIEIKKEAEKTILRLKEKQQAVHKTWEKRQQKTNKRKNNETESNRCSMDLLLKHLLIEDLNKI